MKKPFFILGCVRSGTTFLRDVLRRHPNLASPEETHFYRWADPFGGQNYSKIVLGNKTLQKHREIDGISEDEFKQILEKSTSRADLYQNYMRVFLSRAKPDAMRWFDKTPQNVYGAALLASENPGTKLIQIVRNPLNVVSSLKVGKIVHIPQLVGACNYWNEAVSIMDVLKRAYKKRVYVLRYEDLTRDFHGELKKLLIFIGEKYDAKDFADVKVNPKEHEHEALFEPVELEMIVRLCGEKASSYGYDLKAH